MVYLSVRCMAVAEQLPGDDGALQAAVDIYQECSDTQPQWEIHQLYPRLHFHIEECEPFLCEHCLLSRAGIGGKGDWGRWDVL